MDKNTVSEEKIRAKLKELNDNAMSQIALTEADMRLIIEQRSEMFFKGITFALADPEGAKIILYGYEHRNDVEE